MRKGIKTDPVEQTEAYLAIEDELEEKIAEELEGIRRTRGYCFKVWEAKKSILKRDYGIDWKSPGELNPRIKFD
jgi:hypothetical protein